MSCKCRVACKVNIAMITSIFTRYSVVVLCNDGGVSHVYLTLIDIYNATPFIQAVHDGISSMNVDVLELSQLQPVTSALFY